jgi:hypothetical protein
MIPQTNLPLFFLLALFCLRISNHDSTAHAQATSTTFTPVAFQMGPDSEPGASSFSSAVVLNPTDGTVVVTGSTTSGSEFTDDDNDSSSISPVHGAYRCFVAVWNVTTAALIQRSTLGHAAVNGSPSSSSSAALVGSSQTCAHLVRRNVDGHVVLVGNAGSSVGGVLDSLFDRYATVATRRYGTLMDLQQVPKTKSNINYNILQITGGAVLQGNAAVYPMAIASARDDSGDLFVAAMFSDSDSSQSDFFTFPVDPNTVFPVGRTFGMSIDGYRKRTIDISDSANTEPQRTAERTFRQFYVPRSGASVSVAGLAVVSDTMLVVVGHTFGQGKAFGNGFASLDNNSELDSPTSDGFVTKLRADNGQLYSSSNSGWDNTYRVESMDGGHEEIHGLCHHAYGTDADNDFVYVVGSTTGNVDRDVIEAGNANSIRKAFLMKVKLSTMERVWTFQLSVDKSAGLHGVSCSVTRDGLTVWWAGHVEAGFILGSNTLTPYGEIDIFISKVNAENGKQEFVRQIGSEANDLLANKGGITTDMDGNAIVVGNTFGSLYRKRNEESGDTANVFITTISRFNGNMSPMASHPDFVPPPAPTPPVPTAQQQAPGAAPVATIPLNPAATDDSAPSTIAANGDGGAEKGVVLLSLLMVLIVLVAFCSVTIGMYVKKEVGTERAKVLAYINQFDIEDVDLKHSATGGWHCSYSNGLARGRVRDSPGSHGIFLLDRSPRSLKRDPLKAPLKNSNIVKQSLFMDEELDEDALEYGGGLGRSQLHDDSDISGYGGLVDAYNRTWEDRGPLRKGGGRGSKRKKKNQRNNDDLLSGPEPRWGRGLV